MVCGRTIRAMTWIIIAIPFLLSAWLTWRFANPASRFYIVDHPNERSLHVRPMPRSGGIAILFAVIAGSVLQMGWSGNPQGLSLWSGLALFVVATVSFLDDRYHVSVIYRLVSHIVAAGLLLMGGLSLQVVGFPGVDWAPSAWIGACLSLLFVVWMINLYNFMDGMDGFAGGMAVSGFVTFSIFGWLAGNDQYATVSAVTAAAAAGFLCFNFPPARIFMGDIGSSVLGLLAAAFSLWGARDGVFPFWVAVLVFSPFMADATVTLLRRLWRRETVWKAHKTHYYQQLVLAGWGHRKTVILEYTIMIGCGATALWGSRLSGAVQAVMLVSWVVFYALFFFSVSRLAARGRRDSKG
jgi:UDP-N-acetylmuramyl pentapeptide phosphotransferase/UDP-N-acetylglucosamine-1-phosphate transferase